SWIADGWDASSPSSPFPLANCLSAHFKKAQPPHGSWAFLLQRATNAIRCAGGSWDERKLSGKRRLFDRTIFQSRTARTRQSLYLIAQSGGRRGRYFRDGGLSVIGGEHAACH